MHKVVYEETKNGHRFTAEQSDNLAQDDTILLKVDSKLLGVVTIDPADGVLKGYLDLPSDSEVNNQDWLEFINNVSTSKQGYGGANAVLVDENKMEIIQQQTAFNEFTQPNQPNIVHFTAHDLAAGLNKDEYKADFDKYNEALGNTLYFKNDKTEADYAKISEFLMKNAPYIDLEKYPFYKKTYGPEGIAERRNCKSAIPFWLEDEQGNILVYALLSRFPTPKLMNMTPLIPRPWQWQDYNSLPTIREGESAEFKNINFYLLKLIDDFLRKKYPNKFEHHMFRTGSDADLKDNKCPDDQLLINLAAVKKQQEGQAFAAGGMKMLVLQDDPGPLLLKTFYLADEKKANDEQQLLASASANKLQNL